MKYDVLVIGAGSAGAIMAARLSEDPSRSVLLLEAGPDYPDFEHLPEEVKLVHATELDTASSDHNWQFVGKSTDKAGPMMVPRGKVTGGSSAINSVLLLRGVPEDYDSWAEAGNDEWNFQKLLPYFRKLENDQDFHDDFHGTEGPIIVQRFKRDEWLPAQMAFYNACRDFGYPDSPDQNHPDSSGVGSSPWNCPNGIRFSTALGYLDPTRHRLNFTLRPNCTVHRILFDGKRATGAEVESGGEMFTVEANEIILSAGAIGSPQILMLSGIGPAGHLESLGIPVVANLTGVGQNLRDHPKVQVTWRTKPGFELNGLLPREQLSLRYTADGSNLRNDMKISMIAFATGRADEGGNRMAPLGICMSSGIQLAAGAGELLLTSKDPGVQPHLDYHYVEDPFDQRRLRDLVRLSVQLGEHAEFENIIEERIEPLDSDLASDEALDDWVARRVNTTSHISGTCKMGPSSDSRAVVDQFGKVHGMQGLRVVDASIMPDCIRANTNATSMMIGERIADFVRDGR